MKIYLASSWRNSSQPAALAMLVAAGHEVYDFRNPRPGERGFAWSEIASDWRSWSGYEFRAALGHRLAHAGFRSDFEAMKWADAVVLLLPCGRSAHLELGWAAGAGKRTLVVLEAEANEPELMYLMADGIAVGLAEMVDWLASVPA